MRRLQNSGEIFGLTVYEAGYDPDRSVFEIEMNSDAFWEAVSSAIRLDPFLAAQKTGLPLDRLYEFKPIEPSLTLDAIGEVYLNKTPPLQLQFRQHVTKWWGEFKRIVGRETVRELTAEDFTRYREAVYAAGKGKSHRYANNRFGAITVVFRHNMTEGRDVLSLRTAIDLCRMLRRLKGNGLNPKPVTRDEFTALLGGCDKLRSDASEKLKKLQAKSKLNKADQLRIANLQWLENEGLKWKAILLTALNMAGYPVDICGLSMEAIDLDKKTLCNTRTKTGVLRIAVLWDRTVEAIRAYRQTVPSAAGPVFLTRTGMPYGSKVFIRGYMRIRKTAGISVEFASIRDGAQTAGIEGNADPIHVDMLMGHRAGIKDNYLKRRPQMVKDACEAIEKYYFSSEPTANLNDQ